MGHWQRTLLLRLRNCSLIYLWGDGEKYLILKRKPWRYSIKAKYRPINHSAAKDACSTFCTNQNLIKAAGPRPEPEPAIKSTASNLVFQEMDFFLQSCVSFITWQKVKQDKIVFFSYFIINNDTKHTSWRFVNSLFKSKVGKHTGCAALSHAHPLVGCSSVLMWL